MLSGRVKSGASATALTHSGHDEEVHNASSLKERTVSHNDRRTRIAPLIRKRVDRATNFATKVDLVTAQYPVEEREEIVELTNSCCKT
jgi:hypothetical protein